MEHLDIDKKLINILGFKNFLKIKNYPLFYKKVYLEVLKIPKGHIRTYKWVAEKVGSPYAYRAVGNALKNNPLPVIIPCHRVIKSSGELGGYSGGLEKKIQLLKKEGVPCKPTRGRTLQFIAPVAQLDRASGYEPAGCAFKSRRAQ